MNLIEQLGGYEKAKRELELKEQNSIFQCCTAVDAEMIRSALLQYRRESGLYEAGDIVTRRNGIERDLHKIEIIKEYDIKIFSQDMSHSFWAFKGLFRHATDEEIKVGKRLEVGDAN